MTLNIQQHDLHWALQKARAVVPAVKTGPELFRHVAIDAALGSNEATITATTLETSLEITIPCVSGEGASYLLPHKELGILVAPEKNSAGGSVTINDPEGAPKAWKTFDKEVKRFGAGGSEHAHVPRIESKWLVATVATPDLAGTVHGMDPIDFPTLYRTGLGQDDCQGETETVDRAQFIEQLSWVTRAMSHDNGRPHLAMVHVQEGLMTCTDGHRLHQCHCSLSLDINLPANGVVQLIKLLKGSSSDDLTITKEITPDGQGTWLAFTTGEEWTFVCQNGKGRFPLWRRVVPQEGTAEMTVTFDMPTMAGAVKRMQKLEKGAPVTLAFKEGKVSVSTGDEHTSGVTIDVPATISGALLLEPPSVYENKDRGRWLDTYRGDGAGLVGLNGQYVLEALAKQEGTVTFSLTGPVDAVRFDYEGHMGVLMPVKF